MTVIGIDYGSKRVGIATSDASETLAFPKEVIENTSHEALAERVRLLCDEESARMIVVGHSKDSRGDDNPIMDDIRAFKATLEPVVSVPVLFQEESWSSAEAERFQGKVSDLDASAAAIILQRFLDVLRNM